MSSNFLDERRVATPPRTYRDLVASGVSPGRLVGPHWERPHRGSYRPPADPLTSAQRIVDAAGELPAGGAIGGWAAAYVQGCPWLDGPGELPVLLCVGADVHRTARAGIRWTRSPLEPDEVRVVLGLPVTRGGRTALDVVRTVRTDEDALVVLDALAAHRLITADDLDRAVRRYRGRTGVRRLALLAPLVEPAVRSPWETRLRWCWTQQAGLPAPLVNPPVYDLSGRLLGLPDLLDLEAGLAVEFDGDGHRERGQHHRDNHREEAFEAHGLVVVRADSLDLQHRFELVQRLRSARSRALRLTRPAGWTLTLPTTHRSRRSVEVVGVHRG